MKITGYDLKIGAMVTLTDVEMKIGEGLGRKRSKMNRETGTKDQRASESHSSEWIDVNGARAELGYCRLANTYPDLQTKERSAYDTKLPLGDRVDVKVTEHENGLLLVTRTDTNRPGGKHGVEWYALMVGKGPEYRFAGYFPVDLLLTNERLDTESFLKPAYVARQDELLELQVGGIRTEWLRRMLKDGQDKDRMD